MLLFMKGAGIVGSLLVMIALVIALLKAADRLCRFSCHRHQDRPVSLFVAVFAGVGFMVLSPGRSIKSRRSKS